MAHPKRESYIPGLKTRLGPQTRVVWDRYNDRWDTGRRSLLAYDADCTHHVVIQDDAVLSRDLPAGILAALRPTPRESIVSLYLGRTRAWRPIWLRAQRFRPELRWIRMDELMWGVGVVLPTHRIEEIVELADGFSQIANYDSRISAACMVLQIPVYYPWPSLVSHRATPSLVEGRGWRGRHAYQFLGEDNSAADLNWAGPVVNVQPPPTAVGCSRQAAREAAGRA